MKLMKKFVGSFLGIALAAITMFGGLSLNVSLKANSKKEASAYSAPAQFPGQVQMTKNESGEEPELGYGSSLAMYNPQELGTTTLFSGTSVTAGGTVSDQDINFNIYGNDGESTTKISSTRQEFYLVPNGTEFIDTKIKPDGNTKLEIFFMIPEGTTASDFSAAQHPDVVGCNASDGSNHFGGPLLMKGTNRIQFLYGVWSDGDDTLTAKDGSFVSNGSYAGNDYFNWTAGEQYHSVLDAQGGGATILLEDGSKIYNNTITNSHNPKYSAAATANYNSLYMFGQNNNGGLVNPVKIGIKEVRISKNGVDVGHFFAVEQGSTEFSSMPAPTNCMFDVVTGTYFQNSGSGSFRIEADTSNSSEIDITEATDGGLRGIMLDDSAAFYTYIDGNGKKWAADYLEVNKEDGFVKLHRYIGTPDGTAVVNYDSTFEVPEEIENELLALKTSNIMTVLGNDKGAWMDGIVGPIAKYEIKRPGDASDGVTVDGNAAARTISIMDVVTPSLPSKKITATNSASGVQGAIWKVTGQKEFYFGRASGTTADIEAKNILFSSDKVLQYAKPQAGGYYLEVDVEFITAPVCDITVTSTSGIGVEIEGVLQSTATVRTGNAVAIRGVFDEVLYEFDRAATEAAIAGDYSGAVGGTGNTIILTPDTVNGLITMNYIVKPKHYNIQILGKTTRNDDVFLDDTVKYGYSEEVWYTMPSKLDTDELLDKEDTYLVESMLFRDTCLYVFDHFECNGRPVTEDNSELTIDALTLKSNPGVINDVFTIYAVYQKKFIINLGFEFGGNPDMLSDYTLSSPSAEEFDALPGIDGYAINEGEAAVVLLKPNKRYSVDTVMGDGGTSQISPADYPELLVVTLDQSYDITVTLKHREIRLDYVLSIEDNNSRQVFGVPDYISNGTDANFTMISYEDAAQALAPNQDTLDIFNYRGQALEIYNFVDQKYDLLTDKFAGGVLDATDNDFFTYYVPDDDLDGSPRLRLSVIQQYFVDLSTPGFAQTGTKFTNSDLGSYTVEFVGGEYTSLGEGKYMVDFGTEIKLEQTTGKYGNFVHFTGLNEEENEIGSFIVTGDRYVGINFESTKLAAWIMPTIFSGSGVLLLLALMTVFLVMRAKKLNKEKLAKEAEIRDMKRKFNISDEISKLRSGEDVPQSEIKPKSEIKQKQKSEIKPLE